MSLIAMLALGVGLAMDAFAVSIAKGLALGRSARIRHGIIVGLWFGTFQGVMPLLGYVVAGLFANQIQAFDHWIAFGLLALIGANMIRGSLGEADDQSAGVAPRQMAILAIATSIDALAVGVTLRLTGAPIWRAAATIGVVTFLLSAVGVRIGTAVGSRAQRWATFAGGLILIGLGVKIVLEHTGVLGAG